VVSRRRVRRLQRYSESASGLDPEVLKGTRPRRTFGERLTRLDEGGHFLENVEYTPADVRYVRTGDGETLYAIVMGWPNGATVELDSVDVTGGGGTVGLLGGTADLDYEVDREGRLSTRVPDLAADERPSEMAIVFELSGFHRWTHRGLRPTSDGQRSTGPPVSVERAPPGTADLRDRRRERRSLHAPVSQVSTRPTPTPIRETAWLLVGRLRVRRPCPLGMVHRNAIGVTVARRGRLRTAPPGARPAWAAVRRAVRLQSAGTPGSSSRGMAQESAYSTSRTESMAGSSPQTGQSALFLISTVSNSMRAAS